ncbi:hypothetical protein B0H11DRAFT_1903782 [Mycena galericulata]|nr:hypothetical protein B0H11DRAFT_1903782 [Mycena galericulata]
MSLSGPGNDAVRYRLGPLGTNSGAHRPLPILPSLSINGSGLQHNRGSSDGDSDYSGHPRVRPHRDSAVGLLVSAPDESHPSVAVIKASAFGALRKNRARTKKMSDVPAKTALDVLKARGIEMACHRANGGEMQHS